MIGMPPRAIGLRHLALGTSDLPRAEAFYCGVIGFQVEWRPDPDNLYLRLGLDNLALHTFTPKDDEEARAFALAGGQRLQHFGIVVKTMADVDAWHTHLVAHGVKILAPPRTHRDGARSLYCADPDGNAVQILYHPPISEHD
jgi:catechol 2,3-dioxygenase-like lactoylglutathione lyase family enzyme